MFSKLVNFLLNTFVFFFCFFIIIYLFKVDVFKLFMFFIFQKQTHPPNIFTHKHTDDNQANNKQFFLPFFLYISSTLLTPFPFWLPHIIDFDSTILSFCY